jgi:hypothetical protein
MQKWIHYFFLSALLFFIPFNIYIIGDWLGIGIQFLIWKFQYSSQGNSIITILQELQYIISGIIYGRSAISILIWIISLVFIVGSIFIICYYRNELAGVNRAGLFLMFSGITLLLSLICQYGPLFHGPSGLAIPIGLPVLFVIGSWMYMEGRKEEAGDDEEEVQGVGEEPR